MVFQQVPDTPFYPLPPLQFSLVFTIYKTQVEATFTGSAAFMDLGIVLLEDALFCSSLFL